MAVRRIEHTFDCSPEVYWDMFFSPEFNHSLFVERLRFQRWEITGTEALAHGFRRTVEAIPPALSLPGPINALLKKGTGYTERGEFNRPASSYRLQAISHSLPEKLLVTGEISVPSEGTGCKRIYLAEVKAKIFGVGGMLEERVLNDLEKSLNKAAEHSRQWLTKAKG